MREINYCNYLLKIGTESDDNETHARLAAVDKYTLKPQYFEKQFK